MDTDEYYEEVSDQEFELDQQEEVVGVVVPVNIPLEIQVGLGDNPESPPRLLFLCRQCWGPHRNSLGMPPVLWDFSPVMI